MTTELMQKTQKEESRPTNQLRSCEAHPLLQHVYVLCVMSNFWVTTRSVVSQSANGESPCIIQPCWLLVGSSPRCREREKRSTAPRFRGVNSYRSSQVLVCAPLGLCCPEEVELNCPQTHTHDESSGVVFVFFLTTEKNTALRES